MPAAIGALLALSVGIFASASGLDRDRAFYPTVTIVIASFYALFAVMGGSGEALLPELLAIAVFIAAAVAGFRYSLWLIAAALVLHGVFDGVHGRVIENPGVPAWWPQFCLAYDVIAGLYLAMLLMTGRRTARAHRNQVPGSELDSGR